MRLVLALFLPIVAAAVTAACSSNPNDLPTTATCPGPYDPGPTFDFNNPAVSFRKDVQPIFKESCAFGTCHGGAFGASNNGIFLGRDTSTSDADLADDTKNFFANAVGVEAGQLGAMKFISKGDPRNSYLMHKVDGDLCPFLAQCLGKDCGQSMPQGQEPIAQAKRDTIRRWIAQGANDN